jgi:cob(I)alamin adenosyltransferase
MSIITKAGDGGHTVILCGHRVPKDHAVVEAYGLLDELCSYLGLCRSVLAGKPARNLLEQVQRDIFLIGMEIGSDPKHAKKLKQRLSLSHIASLENTIRRIESKNVIKEGTFYLPGGSFVSANLDVCRTIARKAERRFSALRRKDLIINDNVLIYLNRLSDLLYLLARCNEKNRCRL